ncbi:YjjG family noncanonical pyrimidine nucleotidase [Fructobacillus tropaeoli]|uniref:HAD superfamily (Riboflavin biosynthesis) (YigB) n=1 Tax=Fructobacillus tropaeoli TaxID=709323 RepID=A0ABM9MT54_9LACO|nr:YjjG family noncanonical pyrimidine nucleotidase [Fructobacillus tropaeoli]GIC69455.1 noncanonical pyrimidine nucleotidase, YjjG family [Fructobacillus tropaeoli]CAK1222813.1 FMN and 5-amino-6-(5-phospho-D-ribitylamino)uracil phosphatase YigB [Fructobacillus tropaeoli]CAK1238194.1 FMN and 5-amino-6-(5-phospho-D-ribitylamino)uracil phosphatase YigB [Fructobacillus tropaeoli]
MTYEYLIFDLDDTLLDFTGGEVAAIRQLFSNELGLTGTDLDHALKTYQEINHHLWQQYEFKEIARQQIFEERFQKTLEALGIDYDADRLEQEYATLRDHNYRMLPYATEILQHLQDQYTIIAGTNGQDATQRLRLKETGLDQYFDQIFTSEMIGASKPDAAFFDRIFQDNPQMTKENTVMIGDGLTSDIMGGQNYQLDTIWINPNHKESPAEIKPTQVVEDLPTLEALLQ